MDSTPVDEDRSRPEWAPTRPLRATGSHRAPPRADDDSACRDTRTLPALKALPAGARNSMRHPAPAPPYPLARPDGWSSSGRWRVPDHLPALTGAPSAPELESTQPRAAAATPRFVATAGLRGQVVERAGVTILPGTGYLPVAPIQRTRSGLYVSAALVACLLVSLVGAVRVATTAGHQSRASALLAQDVNQDVNAVWVDQTTGQVVPASGTVPWQAGTSAAEVLGVGGASKPAGPPPAVATATNPPAAATNPPASAPAAAKPTAPPAAAPKVAGPQPTTPPKPAAPPPTAPPKPAAPTAPPAPAPPASGAILPAPVSPWPPQDPWMSVPGHAPYAVRDWAGDPMAAAFGQCTWWAQATRTSENLRGLGNARYWVGNAPLRGLKVGYTPVVNATVVFQPWVQGAGKDGHVAHVLALYPDGWFLISEMNAYGSGGGWGRVSFRYVHSGPGVAFIY
ncbi:MAG TPA: CHAP domain-containing protein [Ktedonobacterales bacterium]